MITIARGLALAKHWLVWLRCERTRLELHGHDAWRAVADDVIRPYIVDV